MLVPRSGWRRSRGALTFNRHSSSFAPALAGVVVQPRRLDLPSRHEASGVAIDGWETERKPRRQTRRAMGIWIPARTVDTEIVAPEPVFTMFQPAQNLSRFDSLSKS